MNLLGVACAEKKEKQSIIFLMNTILQMKSRKNEKTYSKGRIELMDNQTSPLLIGHMTFTKVHF